jgi:hypothetical protein
LSKKFYHLFHNQYDKSSFLEDVKSQWCHKTTHIWFVWRKVTQGWRHQ